MSDLIDRWKNDFKGYVNSLNIPRDDYNGIMAYIDELPSAQPSVTDTNVGGNLIDRQAAIDALAENMPSLTTPDGCGQFDHDIHVTDEAYVDCMQIIHELPPAQPGRKDAVPWEQLERYAEWFCAQVSYPEFIREAKAFCESTIAEMKGENIAPSVTPKQLGWTYIEEALPETIINEHTHDYQEYNCLCDFGDNGFDVRTYKFGNGHFWNGGGIVDKYVTAWQPLPEIPDALKPKTWEGGTG